MKGKNMDAWEIDRRTKSLRFSMYHKVHYTDIYTLRWYIGSAKRYKNEWKWAGPERIVTREDIATFGSLTQNEQWIHDDQERCQRESIYGDIIAHGFFILTLIPSLLGNEPFMITGHSHRIVRGSEGFRFLSPVYPGDVVRAKSNLTDVQPATSGKGTVTTRDIEIVNITTHKTVVTCTLLLQYF